MVKKSRGRAISVRFAFVGPVHSADYQSSTKLKTQRAKAEGELHRHLKSSPASAAEPFGLGERGAS